MCLSVCGFLSSLDRTFLVLVSLYIYASGLLVALGCPTPLQYVHSLDSEIQESQ